MAVVAFDGFDSYNGTGAVPGMQARWNAEATSAFGMVAGRFGGQAFASNNASTDGRMYLLLPAPQTQGAFGFAFRAATLTTQLAGVAAFWCTVRTTSGSGFQLGLRSNNNGAIEAWRATSRSAGTLLGTSANGVIVFNTWHYVECEIVISDTVGVFNVYVDSILVLSLSAQDTRNGAPADFDAISLGHHGVFTNAGNHQFDDFYITDTAAKLGERRVETLYPSADVTGATDWTQSTGANRWSTVDEATVDITDYISATTVGNVERFTHPGMSSTPASIDAVQVVSYGLKTDATARSIAMQVKSGATTSDGANFALATTTIQMRRALLATDPNTAAAWTAAAVNALEFGVKVTV